MADMVDLHLHTTYSDGQYTPAETVRLAAERGVTALSVTDHDAIGGLAEAEAEALRLKLGFVNGVEVSAKLPDGPELHILGYAFDLQSRELNALLDAAREQRDNRGARILAYLASRGVPVEWEAVKRFAGNTVPARPHFALAMIEAGHVQTVDEAFRRHLAAPEFAQADRPKPTPQAAINAIKAAGGVTVLAHPAQYKLPDGELEPLVKSLADSGLSGLECHYSGYTEEQTARYTIIANRYGLIVTGGSDFHGEAVKPGILPGTGTGSRPLFTDVEVLSRLHEAKG